MTGKVAKGAGQYLTEHIVSLLRDCKNIDIIPTSQAEGVLSGLLSGNETGLKEYDIIKKTGLALGADIVMVGYLYRFRERSGTRYAVDSPASVAFDIHLIRVKDGRILWAGHFDETQRSLSENLFHLSTFIKRKGAWIDAREMALSGLENLLQGISDPDTCLKL